MLLLVTIVLVALIIILFGRVSELSDRVMRLESLTKNLLESGTSRARKKKKPVEEIVEEEEEDIEDEEEIEAPDVIPLRTEKDYMVDETPEINWEEFFTKRFFTILGIVSIVLAIGFFAMWAFAHGWIGPKGRIAIGVIVSLGFLVFGELWRDRYPKQFVALTSVGVAGLIITTFIARNIFGFISPSMAFALYVIEVAVGLVLSLRYESRLLGNFSVIGGLIAPMLINQEINGIGLLTYLLVLTIAGFVISLRQRWYEILFVLFIGVSLFEFQVLSETPTAKNVPWLFLALVFVQHLLMGSGGVVRMIRSGETQELEINEDSEVQEVGEILLFIGAILVANAFANQVFEMHGWKHFGFFVLFQGFLWYGAAEYFRTKGLEIFRHIATTATFIAIVFATFYEVGMEHPTVLGFLLLAESFLLTMAGRITDEKWFGYIGRLILLTTIPVFVSSGYEVWEYGLLVLGLLGVTAYQSFDMSNDLKKVLNGFAITMALITFFRWNFDELAGATRLNWELFVLPLGLAVGLAYSITKIKRNLPYALSLVALVVVFGHFLLRDFVIHRHFNDIATTIVLILSLIAGFSILAAAFIEEKKKFLVAPILQEWAVYLVLSLNTLAVLYWSYEVWNSPWTEVVWIAWGVLLLGTGIAQQWPRFRYFGIGMLLLTIAKLYLIDVWGWGMGERVIAFSILGVGLLILSFWGQKHLKK